MVWLAFVSFLAVPGVYIDWAQTLLYVLRGRR